MLVRWQTNALWLFLASSLTAVACGGDDDDSSAGNGGKTNGGGGGATARGGAGGSLSQGGKLSLGGTAGSSGGTTPTSGGRAGLGGGFPEAGSTNVSGAGGVETTGGTSGVEGGAAGNGGTGGAGGDVSVTGGAGGEGGATAGLDPCRGVELPPNSYYVAPGLCVRAVASSQGKLRQLTFDSQGSLIGVTVDGAVLRYRDVNADGVFAGTDEIVTLANTGGNGNNAHIDGGFLYAGTPSGVKRWAYSTTANDLGAGEDVVTGQPSNGNHTFHTVHVYDGWLYVHSGSADNASSPSSPTYDTNRSVLKRFDLSTFTPGTPFAWTAGTVFVSGIRNMVGFTRNQAGRMYGVVNGMDNLLYQTQDVHLDNPGEDLISLEATQAHGYPYCFTASHIVSNSVVVNPGTQLAGSTADFANPHTNEWCAQNSVPPVTFLPPHTAPLDLTFFDQALPAGGLPETFRGGAFVSLHGSWNTTPSVGHQIVYVPFDANGNAPKPTATLTGTTFPFTVVFGGGVSASPVSGTWSWQNGSYGEAPVRPVGVAISPVDGTLYMSSDNAASGSANQGYIYRIALKR